MQRVACKMFLNPGSAAEYRARHDAIWPELALLLHKAGVRNYSIHLDAQSNNLFAYLERSDHHKMESLPEHPIMRRWWDHMRDIMRANPDGSPVVVALEPMFFMK